MFRRPPVLLCSFVIFPVPSIKHDCRLKCLVSATTRSSDAQQDQPNHLVHPAHSINKVPMQPRTEESRQKVPSKTTIQENPSPYYYNENELHTYFPISVKSLIDANITDANSSNDLAENKSDSSFIGGFPTHPSNNSVNEDTVSVHGAKISAQTSSKFR